MADQDNSGVLEASLDTTAPAAVPPAGTMHGGSQQVATQSTPSAPSLPARNGEVLPPRRRRGLVFPLVILIAAGYGLHLLSRYYSVGRFLVSTDDAYVKADISIISAKVAGYVTAVPAAENTSVHSGDLLASIDAGDYQMAIDAAAAKIATADATFDRISRQGMAQDAVIGQARAQLLGTDAQLSAARADFVRASAEYDRSAKLVQGNFATAQRLEQATAERDRAHAGIASAEATVASAKGALAAALANLQVIEAQKVEALKMRGELVAALDKVKRDLTFTQVRAPFDGVVANRAVQTGQYVQPGTRLLALIPFNTVYIEANFKETQLGTLKPGQKVDLIVDSVSGRKFEGVVESIAPASGSQYSLLPPENATGNFTKIVQRVPVHIRVPLDVATSGVLRPGLSVVAEVRTRDESQPEPSLLGALGLPRLVAR